MDRAMSGWSCIGRVMCAAMHWFVFLADSSFTVLIMFRSMQIFHTYADMFEVDIA